MRVADVAVHDGFVERPVIFGRIAMKEVLQHVRDRIAPAVRSVDVIEVNAIRCEAGGKRLAVTGGRGSREARDERGELFLGHAALLFRRLRLIRLSAICTAFSAAPLRRLSDTIHIDSPCSTEGSLRTRETN